MGFLQEKKRFSLKLFSSGVVGKILRKYIRSKNKFKLSVIKIDLLRENPIYWWLAE